MDFKLTIKNYRCFEDQAPLRIDFGRRFTAFVGPNNAGKSTILRWLYEFRHLFHQLQTNNANFQQAARGSKIPFQLNDVEDLGSLFADRNERDLSFEIHPR